MTPLVQKSPPSPEEFLSNLFADEAAQHGGIVQLSRLDMERFIGRDLFIQEMKLRKFTALENRGQIIVIFNNKDLRLLA